jgi:3'-5' exoribonuclease
MGPRLPGDRGPQPRPKEKALTHNPFAALAAKLEGGTDAERPEATEPAPAPETASEPRAEAAPASAAAPVESQQPAPVESAPEAASAPAAAAPERVEGGGEGGEPKP